MTGLARDSVISIHREVHMAKLSGQERLGMTWRQQSSVVELDVRRKTRRGEGDG